MTLAHQQGLNQGSSVEATIPDQLPAYHPARLFPYINRNCLLEPDNVIHKFNYTSPTTNNGPFTPEEKLIFTLAFASTPKTFDQIAAVLPGRTREDCIWYYYAHKWDGRFKIQTMEKSVQQAQSRRHGGLGQAVVGTATEIVRFKMSYFIPEHGGDDQTESVLSVRDIFTEAYLQRKWKRDVPPIHQEIDRLSALNPATAKAWNKTPVWSTIPTTLLRRPALEILRLSAKSPDRPLTDQKLCSWLRSVDVLPLIKRWKTECLDDPAIFRDLQRTLSSSEKPWDEEAVRVATLALVGRNNNRNSNGTRTTQIQVEPPQSHSSLTITAKYAARVAHGNTALWTTFAPPTPITSTTDALDRHLLATLVLFTAYADILRHGECGFFGVLLQSPLVGMLKTGVREKWETKFLIRSEVEEAAVVEGVLQQLPIWMPPVVMDGRPIREVEVLAREEDRQGSRTIRAQREVVGGVQSIEVTRLKGTLARRRHRRP
ncbi:hypothetical protein LTR78_008809 [Recurvomyces mirabilis]|uniref:Myb-like domain-containing protein n=1 Tax=Recurvomyces mirabilis TaxID=574656 RepID=A0AAE0TQG0_9PEZI|nr:hypothetical protein LTR78_008809 [Recurvomyces mirabilis]KAK5160954.1 hypothetical protein LTS14_000747 [Recurvomyces mirabilis]